MLIKEMKYKQNESFRNEKYISCIDHYCGGLNSILKISEERINKLENKWIELIQFEKQRKQRLNKNEQNLSDLWHNAIHRRVHVCAHTHKSLKERRA